MATILIDTEGEYCAINEPTDKQEMLQALRRRGIEPRGVDNTHVLHPVGRDTAKPSGKVARVRPAQLV